MLLYALLIIVVLGLYIMALYNGFVRLDNRAKEAWADIDVQLKRRYNLIPNLVETVKAYAAHEEGVLVKVTEARNAAMNAGTIVEQGQAENMLSGALKSLFAVSESYPDLKANQNFADLQRELVDTEDKIQAARRFYNGVVRDFNTKIEQFPAKAIAQFFQYKSKEFFELNDAEQRENVKVSFADQPAAAAPMAAPAAPAPVAQEMPAEPMPEAPMPEAAPTDEISVTEAPKQPEVEAPMYESAMSESPLHDEEMPAPTPEAGQNDEEKKKEEEGGAA
ncbi:LemA family protein [Candidatus Peregrinibacteria bacterium]|nr:MAG: LemA family protein [Candidatus Peregrinibacteria bacterium]